MSVANSFFCLFVCPFIHPFVVHLPIYLSAYNNDCLSVYLSVHLPVSLSFSKSIYRSIDLHSVCKFISLFTCLKTVCIPDVCQSINMSIYWYICLHCPSVVLSLCLSVCMFEYMSVCLRVCYLSICMNMYLCLHAWLSCLYVYPSVTRLYIWNWK